MASKPPGDDLNSLLDSLDGKKGAGAAPKPAPEDAWIERFNEWRQKVIRPAMEKLGKELEARGHDFLIVEREFRRGNRSVPDEASIRIDLYLADEKTRTKINADRRPGLTFSSHLASKKVHVTICDITSRGGVESKIGHFILEEVDETFIRGKFVALFKRIVAK